MIRKRVIGTAVTTAFVIFQHNCNNAFNYDRSTWREISSTVSHPTAVTGASIPTQQVLSIQSQTYLDSKSPIAENATTPPIFVSTPSSTTSDSTPTGFAAWSETITNLIIMIFLGGIIMKYLKLNTMVREIRAAAQEAIAKRHQNREANRHLWSPNESCQTISNISHQPSSLSGNCDESKEDSSVIFGTYKLELASGASMDTHELGTSVVTGDASTTKSREVYEDSQSLCSDFFTIEVHNGAEHMNQNDHESELFENSRRSCDYCNTVIVNPSADLAGRRHSRSLKGDKLVQSMKCDESPTEQGHSQNVLSRSCPTGLPELADAKPSLASAKGLEDNQPMA